MTPNQQTLNNQAQAKQLRLFSILAWIVAIVLEVVSIFVFLHPPKTGILIAVIIVLLVLSLLGSWMWKKANRLDPASENDKVKFFIQNQLGAIMSVLAFLPLIVLVLSNKDMSSKQKGLVGGIAIVAMLVAGIFGIDLNPPSKEKNAQQTIEQRDSTIQKVDSTLNTRALPSGVDSHTIVYWTKFGKSYHLYKDCSSISGKRTHDIFEGTLDEAQRNHRTDFCDFCQKRKLKEESAVTPKP